ncbi:MAG: hypothetical protein B7X50_04540 [Alishewanella sp. 34-51-39]|nr:MAG: hypothetical protein B7X50_04540 [Alishewanella sp. 34-51-39]
MPFLVVKLIVLDYQHQLFEIDLAFIKIQIASFKCYTPTLPYFPRITTLYKNTCIINIHIQRKPMF